MRNLYGVLAILLIGFVAMMSQVAMAANVKVTPLGSHDGEFCRLDRAMIFEDPEWHPDTL